MDAAEWLESAEEANKQQLSIVAHIVGPLEDEPDKNTDATAAKARTVATTTARMVVHPTARKEKGVIRVVQNPRELALSGHLPGRSQMFLVMYISLKWRGVTRASTHHHSLRWVIRTCHHN